MANIVLTHPKHGAKVAISEQEALNDIANGWSRYSDPVVEVPVESVEQAEPVNSLKRKGRPRKEDTPAFLMPTSED
jgi:hypothetical protein